MAADTEDPPLIAKTLIAAPQGIVGQHPTVDLRGQVSDGAITVTLTLHSRRVHHSSVSSHMRS